MIAGTVRIPDAYAAIPMNATWPNVMIPLLPL